MFKDRKFIEKKKILIKLKLFGNKKHVWYKFFKNKLKSKYNF